MSVQASPVPPQVAVRPRSLSLLQGGVVDSSWVLAVEDLPGTAAALAQLTGLRIAAVHESEVRLATRGSGSASVVLREAVGPPADAAVCRLSFTARSPTALADVVSRAVRLGAAPVRALRGAGRTVAHVRGPEDIEIGFEHRGEDHAAADGEQLRAFAFELLLGREAQDPVDVRLDEVTVASTRHAGPAVRGPDGVVRVRRDVLPTRAVLLGRP